MIKCVIIDDEPLARDLMVDNVSRVPFLSLIAACSSVPEAMAVLNEKEVDLIFLDIEMPEISGINFLRNIKTRPMVIITTAYDQYALEGFNLDVIDYLLKPIPFERFLKAASKAAEYHSLLQQPTANKSVPLKFIFVKSEHKIVKIDLSDILYIESMKDYVKIFCGPKPIFSLMSLKQLESMLPSNDFIRVHRSFIVALQKISFIGKSKIVIGQTSIPISNFYRDDFFSKLSAYQPDLNQSGDDIAQ